ncbi:MAG: glycosyl hydrolase 53 family protein [Lachnospiraceae bacterium]|nr:glycosyl hydrolase 53 family protein [Lachnospiraceae bacterium]
MKKKGAIPALLLTLLTACGGPAKQSYVPELPSGNEEAPIFVEAVPDLKEDFILGMDISSVIAEEESGVVYKDMDGNEKDLFRILADNGVNYVRVRVWNHPYDKDGNGYGGGNCDAAKAAVIGKRAAECGMKLLVDFHYSDFWADPKKQYAPTEWARKDADEKKALIAAYTEESLKTILDGGADVGMVQIGNEINNGLCGIYDQEQVCELLKSASSSVRGTAKKYGRDIKIAVHYTQIDDVQGILEKAELLKNAEVDYDIFGVSYYPYWHGSMENMNSVLKKISSDYGKETCVLETAYPWTAEDGDCFGNSVAGDDALDGYPATPQGQAKCVRDIAAEASDAGAIGVFYWEGAWVPVGSSFESNEKLWEQYGSGWASSYSVAYDPQDAGKYHGGCSWDNQAMFDFDGKALPSLGVFGWMRYGATAPLEVMAYKEIYIESGIGDELQMPEEVEVYYNDPSVKEGLKAEWDASAVDTDTAGLYEVEGTVENGDKVTARVKIMNINYLKNFSFEEPDAGMWTVEDRGAGNTTDIQTKASDALSGEKAFHFYSTEDIDFSVSQQAEGLSGGTYSAAANFQGGDLGAGAEIVLYAECDGTTYESESAEAKGWQQWQRLEIKDIQVPDGGNVTVGVRVKGAAKGWGTLDDIELYSMK